MSNHFGTLCINGMRVIIDTKKKNSPKNYAFTFTLVSSLVTNDKSKPPEKNELLTRNFPKLGLHQGCFSKNFQ